MKKPHKRTLLIIGIVIVVLATAVAGYLWYRNYYKKITKAGVPASSTVEKTKTEVDPGHERAVDPGANPNQPNPNTVKKSSGVPTPKLTKSAGNVAPAPNNVLIDFVCTVPSEGYQCQLELVPKSGQAKPNFAKLGMQPDRSGVFGAVWNWQTVSGKWEVSAMLYNSSGDSARSPIQSFEVQ